MWCLRWRALELLGKGCDPDRNQWEMDIPAQTAGIRHPRGVPAGCGPGGEKKPELDCARLRLETYDEGLCVQMLHTGPYSREQETIDTLAAFLEKEGLA